MLSHKCGRISAEVQMKKHSLKEYQLLLERSKKRLAGLRSNDAPVNIIQNEEELIKDLEEKVRGLKGDQLLRDAPKV